VPSVGYCGNTDGDGKKESGDHRPDREQSSARPLAAADRRHGNHDAWWRGLLELLLFGDNRHR
jgi:hypothetical protein